MAEWKFGTIVQPSVMPSVRVMLVAKSDGYSLMTTDHYEQVVPDGDWLGMTLQADDDDEINPYGNVGDLTWVFSDSKVIEDA